MESKEAVFIVRYRGSEQNCQFINKYLSCRSADIEQYWKLMDNIEVKRATCLKDIFDMISLNQSTSTSSTLWDSSSPGECSDESSSRIEEDHEPVSQNSTHCPREIKEEEKDVESKRENLLITDEMGKPSTSSESFEINKSPIKLLKRVWNQKKQETSSNNIRPRMPRPYPPLRKSSAKRNRKTVPNNEPNTGKKKKRIVNRDYLHPEAPLRRPGEVVSSQTLKFHNICFERSTHE